MYCGVLYMKNKYTFKGVNGFIIHGLVNFVLILIVLTTVIGCGFCLYDDVVSVNKTYNGVIYAGNEKSDKIALMINVYWGTEYLEEMLNILDKYDAKATFFVGTTWVEDNPDILVDIYNRGHEIGNHGSNHKEHGKLGYNLNLKEIDDCSNVVLRTISYKMNLFAPPGGSYNSDTIKAAENLGYKTILWTKDTIDWRDQNEQLIFDRATKNLNSGDLILMHPTNATKNVLERVLEYIKSKNLMPDTVSNTIKE